MLDALAKWVDGKSMAHAIRFQMYGRMSLYLRIIRMPLIQKYILDPLYGHKV